MVEPLCFVIPRIDAFDFALFRDGKIELRQLRSKVLGIDKNKICSLEDINARVADYER